MKFGALPADLGLIDLEPTEMMFWMYCPISVPAQFTATLPPTLKQFEPIVDAVAAHDEAHFVHSYVYLTAKTLWVSGDYIGNRPGWHSDGFGTDDLNYIWSDRAPTEFLHIEPGVPLSEDCDESQRQMAELYRQIDWQSPIDPVTRFPDKHLLRLDPSVIHRSPAYFEAGMRTFVKVSISKDRYDLVGNSINHSLPESHWPLVDRKLERNHPQSVKQ